MQPSDKQSTATKGSDPKASQPSSAAVPFQSSSSSDAPASLAPIPLPRAMAMPAPPPNPETAALNTNQTMGYQVADDKDIIEPEWVNRAKSIVSSNREDPFKQSEQMTAFKVEYMQKRYNKNIKLK